MYSIPRIAAILLLWPAAGITLMLLVERGVLRLAGEQGLALGLLSFALCLSGIVFTVLCVVRLFVLNRRDDSRFSRLVRALVLPGVLATFFALLLLDELYKTLRDPFELLMTVAFGSLAGAATGALVFLFALRKD